MAAEDARRSLLEAAAGMLGVKPGGSEFVPADLPYAIPDLEVEWAQSDTTATPLGLSNSPQALRTLLQHLKAQGHL